MKTLTVYTSREKAILALLAEGFSNKEIAYRLNYSIGTVTNYISALKEKAGARNRFDLMLTAREICMSFCKHNLEQTEKSGMSSAVAHLQMAIDILNTLKETA